MTFALRDPNSKKPTPLTCWVYWYNEGERVRWKISTGLRIEPKRWDRARHRARKGTVEESAINATLVQIERDLRRTFAELEALGRPMTAGTVRDHYDRVTGKVDRRAGRDLIRDYEEFITNNPAFVPATRTNHRKALTHLRAFSNMYGVRLTYGRFDVLVWERFVGFLLRVQGMVNASAWNICKSIKSFLADGYRREHHTNDIFARVTKSRLLPPSESSDKPYLTHDELQRVAGIDLPDHVARVRDLFVFACHTGIRFGDLQVLRPEHRQGDVLRFTTGKNRKSITVPLLPVARDIWERYDGTLPRISNQKANAYLQEVLHAAGVTSPVVVIRYRGTERVEKTVPKWKAIGFHGSKRTFVTLSRQLGISPEALRRATGNTLKTLDAYRLGTEDDSVSEIVRGWEEIAA